MSLHSELETIVANAYAEGHARFGDLGLDLPTYSQRIDCIVHKHLGASPSLSEIVRFVAALQGRDLYLATACAQHSLGMAHNEAGSSLERSSIAWKTLETTYKGFLRNLARFFCRTSFVADDLVDNILADLFMPDRSGLSRIASYDGRSSLSTWLRVIVCNRAINAQRSMDFPRGKEVPLEIPDEPALNNIELSLRARRYETPLEDALMAACQRLTPRERLMLLWRYDEGLQLGHIARLLGIHQANVTRQLERMQKRLRHEVVASLSGKHHLSQLAIRECLDDVVDNPRHSVSILNLIKSIQRPPEVQAGVNIAPANKECS